MRHVLVNLNITQSQWHTLPEMVRLEFDSHKAGDSAKPLDWWQGYAGGKVTCYSAPIIHQGRTIGLNVVWAEFSYANGRTCTIGAVLNNSIEQCAQRIQANVRVLIDGETALEFAGATMLDSTGIAFSLGEVQPFVRWDCVRWLINRAASVTDPPLGYFQRPACPDVPGGERWQDQWSPQDRSGNPQYRGDSRNPDLIAIIGQTPVPKWYDRQTHRPGDYRTAIVSDFFSVWWAAQCARMQGQGSAEIDALLARWADATIWWTAAQVGCPSPTVPGRWVDGRPLHWQLYSGKLFRTGQKYNASELDKGLPFPAEMHEGRPLLRPPGSRFTEHLNREGLDMAQANAGRYSGQYLGCNGADPEHWVTVQLFSIAVLTGNPLAIAQLHYLGQEALGYNVKTYQHSDRTWGNLVKDGLLHPYLFFREQAYLDKARWALEWLEQNRYEGAPYKAYLSRGFVGSRHGDTYFGTSAIGQHAKIIIACVEWSRADPDENWRKRWLDMARYGCECIDQPGIYAPERGGFIDSYPLNGPVPAESASDTRSLAERLEAGSRNPDRSYISWQGWIIPAYAMYAHEVGDQERLERAREWTNILAQFSISRRPVLSNRSDAAWNMLYPLIAIYGRPQFLTASAEPEGDPAVGMETVWETSENEDEALPEFSEQDVSE